MSGLPSHPAEQRLAAAVRGGLDGPAPPDLAALARRRVERERGRTRVIALAAVVGAVLLASVVATLTGDEDDAPSAGASGLGEGSMLTTDAVGRHVPGASLRAPAADVSPIGVTVGPSTRAVIGGYCGDALLVGVEEPAQAWAAEWLQQGMGGPGPRGAVREVVLRWAGPEGADAYAHAFRTTPAECRDPRGAPYPTTTYEPQPPDGSPRLEAPTPPLSLAVAPLTNGASGVVAGTADEAPSAGSVGPDRRFPAWRVRAVRAEGDTVVDLTVVLRSTSASGAAAEAYELLGEALERTRRDDPVS